jgi:tetratricopeptide (TPR) repeat protein
MSSDPLSPAVLEPIAPWLTLKLGGRVLVAGPVPLPLLRAMLGRAESLCLLGPDPAVLGVMRQTLMELGADPVMAVVGRLTDLPFRAGGAPVTPPFDHAFVYRPEDRGPTATSDLAALAPFVDEGPPLALVRWDAEPDAMTGNRLTIVAGSAPFYLIHRGPESPSPRGASLSPRAASLSPRAASLSPRLGATRPPAQPPVAVIVTTRDRAPLLERAVESVLALDRSPAEILVVDDGSEDGTSGLLSRWAGRGVRHLRHEQATGQARAMNDGVAASTADWIAWLDDDDYFLPAKLRLGLRAIRDPQIGLVVTAHYLADARGFPTGMRLLPEFAPGELLRLLLRGSIFLGPTALVRRRAYEAIGPRPYDESLSRAADYRMWWEIARRYRVAAVQVPLTVVCRHPGNQLDRPLAERIYQSVRATLAWVREAIPLAELAGGDQPGAATALDAVEMERAAALMRVGLFALAERDLTPLAAGGHERAQTLLGLAALEQGAYDAAADRFAATLSQHPRSHAAVHGLASARLFLGQRGEAERGLTAAIQMAPQDVLARYHLALCAEPDPTAPRPALALARDLLAERMIRSALFSPAPPVLGLDAHFTALRRSRPGNSR